MISVAAILLYIDDDDTWATSLLGLARAQRGPLPYERSLLAPYQEARHPSQVDRYILAAIQLREEQTLI